MLIVMELKFLEGFKVDWKEKNNTLLITKRSVYKYHYSKLNNKSTELHYLPPPLIIFEYLFSVKNKIVQDNLCNDVFC